MNGAERPPGHRLLAVVLGPRRVRRVLDLALGAALGPALRRTKARMFGQVSGRADRGSVKLPAALDPSPPGRAPADDLSASHATQTIRAASPARPDDLKEGNLLSRRSCLPARDPTTSGHLGRRTRVGCSEGRYLGTHAARGSCFSLSTNGSVSTIASCDWPSWSTNKTVLPYQSSSSNGRSKRA